MQILDLDGNVLYEDWSSTNFGEALELAVKTGTNLEKANLKGKELGRCNLNNAHLKNADLTGAFLSGSDLRYANLEGANLSGANLAYSILDLTYLIGANLKGTHLPSPPMVLLANWGSLSDELTADLMVWDSLNHQNPEAFTDWAKGGDCPYVASTRVTRSANFMEHQDLWGKGKVVPPYELMRRVLAEKCPDWKN